MTTEENGFWYADVKNAKAGDEYKFVLWNSEMKLIKNDPYSKALTNSAGNSIVVDPHFDWDDQDYNMAPWNELVIYEMHIGTFNTPQRDMPGSFKSAAQKIPYLRDLGINAVQLMPVMEFPGDYSWGYNLSYPFAVENSYGKPEDLKAFINEAHKAGIAVILDVVYNHFGPDDLDLWRFDGWYENDKGGIYFYNDWRSETPWGDSRPDYGRDEVKQYLRDNALMWLEEYHADGLRFDATLFIRNSKGQDKDPDNDIAEGWSFMQWINEEIDHRFPYKISIAEDLFLNEWMTKTTGEGGAGFDTQWDAAFCNIVRENIGAPEDEARDMTKIYEQVYNRNPGDAYSRVIYTESHDDIANGKARVPEEISPGDVDNWFARKRSVLGAALVFTSAGIPMLFQGQEFLEDRWFHDKDPLDWNLTERYGGLLDLYRSLISLRRNMEGKTKGLSGQNIQVYHVNNNDKILAMHRWNDGGPLDSTLVVMNFRNSAFDNYVIGVPAPGKWVLRFNSDWKGYDEDFTDSYTGDPESAEGETDGMQHYISLTIGPYAVLIFSQE